MDEPNLYTSGASSVSGLFRTKRLGPAPQALRSARRWAAVGLIWGVVWMFGFGSFAAIFASGFSFFEYRRAGRRPTPAIVGLVIGFVGLGLAFAVGLGIIG